MRIGVVESGIPPARIGGAERQAWQLACHLGRNHEVTLFTRWLTEEPREEAKNGITIVRIPVARYPLTWPTFVQRGAREIRRRAHSLDALLCFRATPGGVIGALVNKSTKLPFCVFVQGGDWYFVKDKWWGKRLLNWVFRQSRYVVAQAPTIASEISQLFKHAETEVIPNGVEVQDGRQAAGDAVLFVGNLIRRKGVDVLLEAMREEADIPVVIAGDGPDRARLEQMALGMNVTFLGRVPPEEVIKLMVTQGRIFVLPAIAGEGSPNVLFEAMSVGLPVVASAVAGIPDLLQDGAFGWPVRPGDAEALRAKIRWLWDHEEERRMMAKRASDEMRAYSFPRIAERWASLLAMCREGCLS